MLRVVIDTNIWIRILLRGRVTLPVLTAWQENQFQLVMSQYLLAEYDDDLRADDELRSAMADYGVELWGVSSLLNALKKEVTVQTLRVFAPNMTVFSGVKPLGSW